MIIAYENSLMYVGTALPADVPEGCRTMDDSQLEECFAALTDGKDVFVRITLGVRRFIQYLKEHYRYVKAAGGVVSSPDTRRLMISRGGRWDLPKGMVEPGETLRAAACREVTEETGVVPDHVGDLITKTYHIYDKYGGWHLKQTSWYAMTATRQAPRPQTEEEIAQAVWVAPEVCRERLMASYASLRLVAKEMNF